VRDSRPLIRLKPTFVSAVFFCHRFSPIPLKKTLVPGGTGNLRISLIPRCGSDWNRKVPNATLSGVECHSSSGAKHRRRSTPDLNGESRLALAQTVTLAATALVLFLVGLFDSILDPRRSNARLPQRNALSTILQIRLRKADRLRQIDLGNCFRPRLIWSSPVPGGYQCVSARNRTELSGSLDPIGAQIPSRFVPT
jgi:hypothetical protein